MLKLFHKFTFAVMNKLYLKEICDSAVVLLPHLLWYAQKIPEVFDSFLVLVSGMTKAEMSTTLDSTGVTSLPADGSTSGVSNKKTDSSTIASSDKGTVSDMDIFSDVFYHASF